MKPEREYLSSFPQKELPFFKSNDFIRMLMRAFALQKKYPDDVKIWRYMKEPGNSLPEWISWEQRSQSKSPDAQHVHIVSGEFNPMHWNRVDFAAWQLFLDKPDVYPQFSMKAICSPFIAIPDGDSSENIPFQSKVFAFFIEAARRKDKRVKLFRSEKRMHCHWVSCGKRAAISDMHEALIGDESKSEAYTTFCVEASDAGIMRKFAEEEFDISIGLAIDKGIAFREEIDNLDAMRREEFNHSDGVPKNDGYCLMELKSGCEFEDATYSHFGNPGFYLYDGFMIGSIKQIRAFVQKERNIHYPRRFYQEKLYVS